MRIPIFTMVGLPPPFPVQALAPGHPEGRSAGYGPALEAGGLSKAQDLRCQNVWNMASLRYN